MSENVNELKICARRFNIIFRILVWFGWNGQNVDWIGLNWIGSSGGGGGGREES